jgi:hypothetical protein
MTDEQKPQEQEAQAEGLSVQDLNALRTIIDVASQRGAFKPNEMAQVGSTYNKLDAFLNEIARQQEEAKAAQEGDAPGQPAQNVEVPQGE